jgi:hypothetical protein
MDILLKGKDFLVEAEENIKATLRNIQLGDHEAFIIQANKALESILFFIGIKGDLNLDRQDLSLKKLIELNSAFLDETRTQQLQALKLYRNVVSNQLDKNQRYFKECVPIFISFIKWFHESYLDKNIETVELFYTSRSTILNGLLPKLKPDNRLQSVTIAGTATTTPRISEMFAGKFKQIVEMIKGVESEFSPTDSAKTELLVMEMYKDLKNEMLEIKNDIKQIDRNMEKVLELVIDLADDIGAIKNTPLDIEEKLALISDKLDEIPTKTKEVERFISIVQKWLNFDWEKLDDYSKSFLPSAEYLYSEIANYPNADFSPFVLQYCRALENELLKKIFHAYIENLRSRKHFENSDFNEDLRNFTTKKFTNRIKYCLTTTDKKKWNFELGTMLFILNKLNEPAIVSQSPILSDFKEFISNTLDENLLESSLLVELDYIKKTYRNKSAHPDYISAAEAKQGKEDIRDAINHLLEKFL